MPSIIFHFTKIVIILALAVVFTRENHLVFCFDDPLNYTSFPRTDDTSFITSGGSYIIQSAIQVTPDTEGGITANQSGRIVYHKRFKVWNKRRQVAWFNSTFRLNITPKLNGGGEGVAFILAKDYEVPKDSYGQWLGIVNATTNGSSQSSIVAVEFDTKKSFPEDIDNNHVGLNINSVYSEVQVPLNSSDIVIASGPKNITAMILFNGSTSTMDVYVYKGNRVGSKLIKPIISMVVDLKHHFPGDGDVYVGFSGSTGSSTELNCVVAWFFDGEDLDEETVAWVRIVVPVVIGFVLLLGFAGVYLYLYWIKRRERVDPSDGENTIRELETGLGPKKMKLKHIKSATGNFNEKNELGRGGFGVVYLGNLDGIEVAVKRIENTVAGKQNLIAEVTTIGSVHHKNLVKLIGWCHENSELILVYEYMPNRSLDYYIHPNSENQHKNKTMLLTWERRHNIVCGVAQALDYLHNECTRRVLHRDIKASNIMLDSEFNACLGDFGLARMFSLSEKTHHSTKEIAGTPGYMAPEIFHTGRASAETDVYAFGVLALVVASGKKAVFESESSEYRNSIVDWVWELHHLDIIVDATDPKLEGKFNKVQAECMLVLGLACCHPNPSMRPSMKSALQVLMGESLPPLVPCEKPAFVWPATSPSFTRDDSSSGGMLTPFSTITGR